MTGMISIIVAGRNDDYGKDFRQRLFRTALHNCALLQAAGLDFEYILAEWNPLPDRPPLSEEFVSRVPSSRAVIVPAEMHEAYSLNAQMPFHEMAAKNTALRRAHGDYVIVTNADILFSQGLVDRLSAGRWCANTLYRAHRIDVKPELGWDEIQNPANQLASGEGTLCPPYYLGAGGDFCFASRSLWHALGGFNERIRFSTRAKDWQFFLSAAAQGAAIEFIGDVYHLDHEGGFRNTTAAEQNTEAVHFGRWWDIEFGLPVRNREDWGFHGLEERAGNDARIVSLEAKKDFVPDGLDHADRAMKTWLTRAAESPDMAAAILFHTICAAHRLKRRVICRITDPRVLVTLCGLDAVASRFSVPIYCDSTFPDGVKHGIAGYTVRPISKEPATLRHDDWIVEETNGGIRVRAHGDGAEIHPLPAVVGVREPEFNPVLTRRLLLACLRLQEQKAHRVVIYGAGGHTGSLLQWGLPDILKVVAIVNTSSLSRLESIGFDAVLLSSASFESDMAAECRRRGIRNVIALYGDWPKDIWKIGATA